MCRDIYTCAINVYLTPCDTFVWQCVKALAAFDLLWVTVISLAVIFIGSIINTLIKFKEDGNE